MTLSLRSLWRWRDALFEGPSDNVSDGPSLRSQAATGPCSLTSLEQERPSAFDLPFWYARSASKGDQQPSTSHRMTSQGCRKTLSGTSSPWLASINFT